MRNLLVVLFLAVAHLGLVSLFPRQIKSLWRQGLSHPGRSFACVALSSLSCSRACTAGLFSPTFTCRTIQLFSLALVQLIPLCFLLSYCYSRMLHCFTRVSCTLPLRWSHDSHNSGCSPCSWLFVLCLPSITPLPFAIGGVWSCYKLLQ